MDARLDSLTNSINRLDDRLTACKRENEELSLAVSEIVAESIKR